MTAVARPPIRGQPKFFAQAFCGSLTPGQERTHTGQKQQEHGDGDVDAVEKRRADADFRSANRFGEHRKERAGENRYASYQEN